MAIEAQLRPEISLGGLPMFGLPPSSSHQDYNVGCGFNFSALSPGRSRKRQRYEREQLLYMQQLQSQLQPGHQNLCSVSGFQDGTKEVERKDRNLVGLDQHSKEMDEYLRLQVRSLSFINKFLFFLYIYN